MSLPTNTHKQYFPKLGSAAIRNLAVDQEEIKPLKSYEVLVKIHAVSLNYRDLMIAKGNYYAQAPENLVPCSDMAGEVVAVGEDVKQWKSGDRVCANFATEHLDGDITPEIQATALAGNVHGVLQQYKAFITGCAGVTAYNALLGPVPLKAGDTVLVLGTGGVSIFGLQIAVASGAHVIATSSSDEKLALAKKLGATHVINYKGTPDWEKEVLRLTNGRGVDHVLEVGGSGTLLKSMLSTRYAGWVHIIGSVSGGQDIDRTRLTITKALTLRGIQIGSVKQFQDLNRLIIANPEKIRPVVDKVFAFRDAIKAFEHLESQAHVGKVVIKVSDD